MEVSRAVVDRLRANGIDTVFGIPGTQTLPLNEAIANAQEMQYVMARHETAVSHQAWGYAETSGRPAATLVVPGPGDMNAMNGLKNALNDCTPLVHLAVETDPEIRGGDGIHETPPETYDTVVKENVLVESPARTAVVLEEAIAAALTPPTGPVRVGIPKSFLTMDVPVSTPGAYDRTHLESVPEADLEAAADLLAGADEPVMVAGGGVRTAEAGDALRRVADMLGAPVVTTYKGKGVLPETGGAPVAGTLAGSAAPELLECLESADAAVAVGTDFDAVATRNWTVELPDDLVHVTLDPRDLGTGYDVSVGLVADAREALEALEDALADRGREADPDAARERAQAVRSATSARLEDLRDEDPPLSSVAALETIRETLPEETIVTADAGGFRVWGLNVFAAGGPRKYVNPGSWATMGTGLPSAIGAQCANPDADVVTLTGDGGLMMCVHELHTAVAEALPITVVVFANADYAIIGDQADREYGLDRDAYGWSDAPIAFTDLAESMGMEATRVAASAEIASAIEGALATDAPVLLEVPTDPTEPQASDWMAE